MPLLTNHEARIRVLLGGSMLLVALAAVGCGDDGSSPEPLCAEPSASRYLRATNPASGVAAAWPLTDCIPWRLDHRGSAELAQPDVLTAVTASFDAWATPACSPLCFAYAGETDDVEFPPAVGRPATGTNANVVIFEPSHEAWLARFSASVLSATVVTSGVETGTILDADIVINDADFAFTVDGACPSEVHADLANVVTHEVGHFLGFAHVTARDATMFGQWYPPDAGRCELGMQSLAYGDLQGLCTVYGDACVQP